MKWPVLAEQRAEETDALVASAAGLALGPESGAPTPSASGSDEPRQAVAGGGVRRSASGPSGGTEDWIRRKNPRSVCTRLHGATRTQFVQQTLGEPLPGLLRVAVAEIRSIGGHARGVFGKVADRADDPSVAACP